MPTYQNPPFRSIGKLHSTLYIKLGVGQNKNYAMENIYLVCYPIFEKKETDGKEVE